MRALTYSISAIALALLAACQAPGPVHHASNAGMPTTETRPAAAAKVDFRLAQTQPAEGLAELRLKDASIWLLATPVMNGDDIMLVEPRKTAQGQAYLRFRFNHPGSGKLAALSQRFPGKLLVLTINDELVAVPRIRPGIDDGVLDVALPSEAHAVSAARLIASRH